MKFARLMHFFLESPFLSKSCRLQRQQCAIFLKEYQALYGLEYMTFNSHLLYHIPHSVEMWGPLWNYSAYPFEDMNEQLTRLVNGTRFVHWQIVEKYGLISSIPRIWSRSLRVHKNENVLQLMKYLLKGYKLRKATRGTQGIVMYSKRTVVPGGLSFKKVTIGDFTYSTSSMDKSRRRNPYVESNVTFGQIERIVRTCSNGCTTCVCEKQLVFYLRKLAVKNVLMHVLQDGLEIDTIFEVSHTKSTIRVEAQFVQNCMPLTVGDRLCSSRVSDIPVFDVA